LAAVTREVRAAGGRADHYTLDLSREDDVVRFADLVQREHPRLDVIVSNAGRSVRRGALDGTSRRDLDRLVRVNLTGPAALILALLPRMIEQGGGHVVSSSTVSVKPPAAPRWTAYQASKTAFDVWLRGLALELRGRGVRCTSVYLPLVRTPMSAPTKQYQRLPALSAREAAQVMAFAVVTRRARVAPWWLRAQELAAVLLPGPLDRLLAGVEERERRA
ncbi:SDR family NAD(P)-dependent oxidoreductase, partial [Deinococcus pimensis]|uniref:SDR family NAD(P)-dependent oxidoreductase n=1 Tax=Deinococcus pimensis TaxID=309888 RepID=UPI0006949A9E